MDERLVDECVSSLYDTVLDSTRWTGAIGNVAGLFEASSAALFEYDYDAGLPSNFRLFGHYPEVEQRYSTYYHRLDPGAPLAMASAVGSWLADEEMLDLRSHTDQEYVHDFALRSNIGRVCGAKVAGDEHQCLYLSLQRPPGAQRFGEPARRLYDVLAPHLRRVCQIQARLDELTLGERIARAALDRLQFSALVCTGAGQVVIANRSAVQLLVPANGLYLRAQQLVARDPAENEWLMRALRLACDRLAPRGGALRAGRDPEGEPLSAIVLPIPQMHDLSSGSVQPIALVAVSRNHDQPAPQSMLRSMFGLSDAEAALVAAIAMGHSVAEIAQARSVRLTTVRTQLQSLMAKTGCTTQAALVNLVRSLPPVR